MTEAAISGSFWLTFGEVGMFLRSGKWRKRNLRWLVDWSMLGTEMVVWTGSKHELGQKRKWGRFRNFCRNRKWKRGYRGVIGKDGRSVALKCRYFVFSCRGKVRRDIKLEFLRLATFGKDSGVVNS